MSGGTTALEERRIALITAVLATEPVSTTIAVVHALLDAGVLQTASA